MKAIRAHDWCGPRDLVIDEIDQPQPSDRQVLVRVNVAGLNFPDLLIITGKYQFKPTLPFSPGFEIAGTVEKIGPSVTRFSVGEHVIAQVAIGGFAEYAIAEEHSTHSKPAAMSDDEAASFPLVYQTAYFGLAYRGALQKGETVLIHSAAGGVGLAAVQIARALGAGKIIATVGSDEKLALVRDNGADVALNYQVEDFVDVVKRVTNGRGADVIYDPVGGEIGERSTKCIAFEGRLVLIGFTSGRFSNFVANHILVKNYSVVGLHWGAYRYNDPAKIEQGWNELLALYDTGTLKPVIGGRFHMERVADAMEFLASRKAVGKVVLHW
ncbi:MAG TPA: NADPH:quinone oxidoreductase family protein [Blastocatellia bacterium]|nr:NADPH:quinone oxidoreductase family protein [Blastocatellia bacterium]